jgi:flagellar hook-basal body complex protein FliE
MAIEPIVQLSRLERISGAGGAAQTQDATLFKSIFEQSIQNVIDSDSVVAADAQALVTGDTDDLHTLAIDQTKAQLSISLMVQMRNRFMDAYNELMRISL